MEIETHVPIMHSHGFRGFGTWDRRRKSCPPLDFWARDNVGQHLRSRQRTRSGTVVTIPEAVLRGFGMMHLDDWIPPRKLIGPVSKEDHERVLQALTNNNWMQMADEEDSPVESHNVFEVKLNVSDYDLHELKVKVCFGLVTIQGQHEEDYNDPQHDRWGHQIPSHGSRRFKRTVTLPDRVVKDDLQCSLTEDGHLILYAPAAALQPKHQPLTRTARLLKEVLGEQIPRA